METALKEVFVMCIHAIGDGGRGGGGARMEKSSSGVISYVPLAPPQKNLIIIPFSTVSVSYFHKMIFKKLIPILK